MGGQTRIEQPAIQIPHPCIHSCSLYLTGTTARFRDPSSQLPGCVGGRSVIWDMVQATRR